MACDLFFQKLTLALIISISTITCYLIAMFLLDKQKINTALFLLISVPSLDLIYYSCVLGKEAGAQNVLLSFVLVSCIFFDKFSPAFFFRTAVPIISYYWLIYLDFSIFDKIELSFQTNRVIEFSTLTTALFIITSSVVFFIILIKKQQNNLEKANQEIAEKTKHETEIKLGKKIQESYLVTIPPHYEAYPATHFNAYYKGAKQVSGDYYTAHLLDKHRLRFVILDINGKGLEAAFTMIHTHTIIEPYICSNMPPHECLAHINNDLLKMPVKKTSCDLFFGELDLETRTLTYSNASLEVAYVIKQNKQVVCLNMSGFKTGLLEDETYTSSTIRLEKGDTLLFATDGLIDMLDKTRPEGTKSHKYAYTGNRLKQFLASKTWEVGGLKERLVAEINRFEGDLPQIDDTTFLTVEFG